MEEFGDTNKRLWPTEFGWGSTPSPFPGYEYEARIDEATQGRWIVDAFNIMAVSYTHLRAHETVLALVCRLLPAKKNI